jgi:hypothetical protein
MGLHIVPQQRPATQAGAAAAMAMGLLALVVTFEVNAGPPQDGSGLAGRAPEPDGGKVGVSHTDAAEPKEPQKVGLIQSAPRAFEGYTLFAPMSSHTTYLIDIQGHVVHEWESDCNPALCAYLLENGHLLRPGVVAQQSFGFGPGAGGRIQEFTWDGDLVWDFKYASDNRLPHHDITRLPNGNVLLIAWEKKNAEEATAAGRKRPNDPLARVAAGDMHPDCLIEVKPTGKTSGEIVWEWHVWDHLIQDHDRSKPNYGNVSDHPELVDINIQRGVDH